MNTNYLDSKAIYVGLGILTFFNISFRMRNTARRRRRIASCICVAYVYVYVIQYLSNMYVHCAHLYEYLLSTIYLTVVV